MSYLGNKELVTPRENVQLSDSVIVGSIPKTMRSRAFLVRNENRWREAQIDSSTDKDIADGSPTSSSKYFETLLQRHKSTPEQTQKRWLNY